MPDVRRQLVCVNRYLRVHPRPSPNRRNRNVEPRRPIAEHHVEWRRRRSFLVVTFHSDPIEVRTTPQETFEFDGITVVVEVHVLVLGEQSVEGVVGERVGMGAAGSEDHEVGDVHDSNTEGGDEFAEECGGCDDFKGDFDTNTDEDTERACQMEAV